MVIGIYDNVRLQKQIDPSGNGGTDLFRSTFVERKGLAPCSRNVLFPSKFFPLENGEWNSKFIELKTDRIKAPGPLKKLFH